MKTKMLSIALMFVVMSAITKSTYANTATTVLSEIKSINKIELHGNVELFISDSAPEQVTVYNKYYAENAMVQNSKGVLRISSYGAEKLIVWVTSDNLAAISAYDNAEVRSFGDISKVEFNIDLHDNATAKLNFNTYSAHVTLTDHAAIELSGMVSAFGMNRSTGSTVINHNFSVDHNTENRIINQTGKKEVLAGLE